MHEGTILVENPEQRRPLERCGSKWRDNIKMVLKAIGLERVEYICMAQNMDAWSKLVNVIMNVWVL